MHSISALLVSFLLLFGPLADGWLGVYLDGDRDEAVVIEVIPGSPAAKAGVRVGDVLLAVGDQATPTREKLIAAIGAASAGDRVPLKVQRDGRESILVVKLGKRPETVAIPPVAGPGEVPKEAPSVPMQEQAPAAAADERAFLGVALFDSANGIQIERVVPDSPAASAGVVVGDCLVTFGEQPVGNQEALHQELGKCKPGQKVAVGLKNKDGVRSVMVTLGRRPAADEGDEVSIEAPARVEKPAKADKPAKAQVRAAQQPLAPRRATRKAVDGPADLEAELEALRQELRELRKQLEELRKQSGRE